MPDPEPGLRDPNHPVGAVWDRVVILKDDVPSATQKGLALPANFKTKINQGVVVAVGEGTLVCAGDIRPVRVKPGDRVAFSLMGASEIVHNDRLYISVRENDVLAVLYPALGPAPAPAEAPLAAVIPIESKDRGIVKRGKR